MNKIQHLTDVSYLQKVLNDYVSKVNSKFPLKFGFSDLKREININKSMNKKIDDKNLIVIDKFKTERAYYYYNPELYEDLELKKLQNKIYVNYRPSVFAERVPQIKIEKIFINDEKDYFKLDNLFIEYNNKFYSLVLHIGCHSKVDKSYIVRLMLEKTKLNFFVSCCYKFLDQ